MLEPCAEEITETVSCTSHWPLFHYRLKKRQPHWCNVVFLPIPPTGPSHVLDGIKRLYVILTKCRETYRHLTWLNKEAKPSRTSRVACNLTKL